MSSPSPESDFERFQVRCENCQTSFAPETRRCIHCGALLGAGMMAALRSVAGEGEAAGESEPPRRAWWWVVTAVLALVGSLMRQCQ